MLLFIMDKIRMLMLLGAGFIFSSSGCNRERNESLDDKLTLERIAYNGNELRIGGYYYNNYYSGEKLSLTPYFLYKNGIILGGVSFRANEITEMEEKFRNGYYETLVTDIKYLWGVFQIDGNKIKYEKWVASEGPFSAFIYEGMILNDTTFVINKAYRMADINKKAPQEVYREYHFKQFTPKPDSTNRFIP